MTKSPQDLQIAILGAGMGGLTSALALAQQGFKNIDVSSMPVTLDLWALEFNWRPIWHESWMDSAFGRELRPRL